MTSPYSPRSCLQSQIPDAARQRERMDFLLIQESPTITDLKMQAWKGCSMKSRGKVWRMLIGYEPLRYSERRSVLKERRLEYKTLQSIFGAHSDFPSNDIMCQSEESQAILRQIDIDLPRTHPGENLLHTSAVTPILRRILYLFAKLHPDVGYVQGMNEIIVPVLLVFIMEQANPGSKSTEMILAQKRLEGPLSDDQMLDLEADTYWTFSKLIERVSDIFVDSQPGMHRKLSQLENVVERVDPILWSHLKNEGCQVVQFAYRWIAVFMLRELNISLVIPLWDVLLSRADGFDSFFVFLSAAFLVNWRDELLVQDFQGMVTLLLNLPTGAWIQKDIDMLISQADVWINLKSEVLQPVHHLARS
jgi:TBC1 domain family member 2